MYKFTVYVEKPATWNYKSDPDARFKGRTIEFPVCPPVGGTLTTSDGSVFTIKDVVWTVPNFEDVNELGELETDLKAVPCHIILEPFIWEGA